MKISIRKGLGFGLTSGIITTLGLMVGLYSGTHSKLAVLGGILFIAIADSLADALGIHISEEAGSKNTTKKQVWESTSSTFLFKFIFALSFVIPVLLLNLQTAIIVSLIWGFSLLTIFSFYMAKKQNKDPKKAVIGHLIVAVVVVIITNFLGKLIAIVFV
jgi:VIT1/CCC1 family predicted Fe2+/Mn2+ transporter